MKERLVVENDDFSMHNIKKLHGDSDVYTDSRGSALVNGFGWIGA